MSLHLIMYRLAGVVKGRYILPVVPFALRCIDTCDAGLYTRMLTHSRQRSCDIVRTRNYELGLDTADGCPLIGQALTLYGLREASLFRAEAGKKLGTVKITHIMVPYRGNAEEQEMLRAACRIALAFKAKLSIVHVLEVPMTLPVNTDAPAGVDEANAILDQAEDIVRSTGVKTTGDLLQAREAGHAIVKEAIDRGVDLIFMEAKHDQETGMQSLGRTVEYVLKHALCAVWISRQIPINSQR